MKKTLKIWLIVLSVLTVISCLAFTVLAVSGETEPEQISEPILGDANGDGNFDVRDVVYLSRAIAAYDYDSGEPIQVSGDCDLNGDGSVDVADLVAMRYYFANSDFYEDEVESLGLLELNNGIELRVNSDGSFKVLILSDVQCYDAEGIVNSGTLDIIEAMLEKEDPDLVLFLGDNSWSCNTAEKLRAYLDVMVAPIEAREIPWAHVYGNHDAENSEYYSAISKEEQQAVYLEYDFCVSKTGTVTGVGNYVLPVLSADGSEIAFNVWALDSMMYRDNPLADVVENKGTTLQNYFYGKYEGMSEDQVDWYKKTSKLLENYNGGKKIPAMMYFHIPVQESYYAWADAMTGGANGATNLIGQKAENISCPVTNVGLFDAIVERGDVKVIANGHDHINDFSVDYKGVTLAYSGSTGVQEYSDYDIVGARVVDFSAADGSVTTHMSYVKDIDEYNNENPIINMQITESGVANAADGRFGLTHAGTTSNNSISYDEELSRYVLNFNGSANSPGVYNYPAANLTPILYDGFSYEIVFKVDDVSAITDRVGILDLSENGGFGLSVCKDPEDSTGSTYVLSAGVSKGKTTDWNYQEATLNVGEWYHVVYSYDRTATYGKNAVLYVNGVKIGEGTSLSGIGEMYRKPSFTSNPGVEDYLSIGAIAKSGTTGINGFDGSIALCNLFAASTDGAAAFNLYCDFKGIDANNIPILDLQIGSDGSVTNGAVGRPQLNDYTQAGSKEIVYDEDIGKYVISFEGDNANPSTYTLPAGDFNSAFADGFAYEVMFKITDISKLSGSYHGILDFEEGGGFGLNIHKGSADGTFKIETEVSAGATSGWVADFSGDLELDTWYHCVFVYTGSSTAVYVNGVWVDGTEGITAPYRTPSFGDVSPYICIGGCAQVANSPTNPNSGVKGMTGSIAIANIFENPLTAEEALALYNAAIAE